MTQLPDEPPGDDDLGWLLGLDDVELTALLEQMAPAEQAELMEMLETLRPEPEPWEPMPHQVPPPLTEQWFGWLLLAGRGTGKTAAVTRLMDEHALGPACFAHGSPHRMGIIAPTLGDASASIVHGVDGLKVINPTIEEKTRKGGTVVLWPNGAEASLFGVHTINDVDRLRAKGNRCFDVREEIAAWRYLREGMAQANLGLRIPKNARAQGRVARWVGATTPRSRPTIRKLNASPIVRVSTATTRDNVHLPEARREQLYEEFGGTRQGLQELDGKILDDVSGALWEQELIEMHRVRPDEVPRLTRVRTYVDPSWGTKNDECGIIVCGIGVNRHVYVLGDLSKRTRPLEWAMIAALGYLPPRDVDGQLGDLDLIKPRDWFGRPSERVVAEQNFQGEQVRLAMKLASTELQRPIPFGWTVSSKGKRLRAEPVVLAYQQGRVHHVGELKGLEFQLTNWVPPDDDDDGGDPGDPAEAPEGAADGIDPSKWSPDRLDAVVFGVNDLILSKGAGNGKIEVADGRLPPSAMKQTGPPGNRPTPGRIPASTRQGRLVEGQMKGRRSSQ